MKTLTLTQPWASLIAIGAKRIETRSWGTAYRGPLAIHAAKGFPRWARDFTLAPVCYEAVQKLGYKTCGWFPAYPLGAVIATCTLIDCVPMKMFRFGPEGESLGIGKYTEMLAERPQEREFGDYAVGRFAWILGSVECFENPVEAKGSLGLWEWEPS
jgi:activating signal cointegrator 1